MASAGAALYRWRGHASEYKKYFPRPFNQIAFALPYALICPDTLSGCIVLIVSTLGVLTGHGGFMDLGAWDKPRKSERLEFLISWLKPHMDEYWYDAVGLALTGLVVTLPAGIATANPLLAVSGALKAPAYMIGWKHFNPPTAAAEWITGAFLWGTLSLAI